MSSPQTDHSNQKAFSSTIPTPTASESTVRAWIQTWPFPPHKNDISTRQTLALVRRRVSLTGAQIRELDADAMERYFVKAGFCEGEAKEIAGGIVMARIDEEKEMGWHGSTTENSLDWDKLVWDLAWAVVPLLLLYWAYNSVNHEGTLSVGPYCGVREIVAFTGGMWVGIWIMAYPRLSYRS